jgi:hypothetical protein
MASGSIPDATNNGGNLFPGDYLKIKFPIGIKMNEYDVGLTGKNLVFVVGCPRSGTTWLQRLLATHPQIKTGQESRVFEYVGSQFRIWRQDFTSAGVTGRGGTGLACYLREEEFLAIQKEYLAFILAPMLKELQPDQIFLEKTPAHALFIPEIARLLPAAKIIHLIRDPRDVVASLLAAARGWGRAWAPRQVRAAVRQWRQHVDAAQTAGALLPPGQFLEIHYEDLYDNPVKSLREAARFLHLPWSDAEIGLVVATNTADELRQGKGTPIPIYGEHGKQPNSVVQEPRDFIRKARPGSWREDLTLPERWQLWHALRGIAPAGLRCHKK